MPEADQHVIDMGTQMESLEGLTIIDALNEVSEVRALSGRLVTFVGTRLGSTGPVADLADVEVYACPMGTFLHGVTTDGPHWGAGGATVADAIAAIEDDEVRDDVAAALASHGLA
jgi:hypothetical protein